MSSGSEIMSNVANTRNGVLLERILYYLILKDCNGDKEKAEDVLLKEINEANKALARLIDSAAKADGFEFESLSD